MREKVNTAQTLGENAAAAINDAEEQSFEYTDGYHDLKAAAASYALAAVLCSRAAEILASAAQEDK